MSSPAGKEIHLFVKFDRDVFEKLVEKVIIKGKDNIMFEFKDGTSLKAEIEL